ncbi:MAG: DNA methyltransferase [Methanobacteriaceae archaeon]
MDIFLILSQEHDTLPLAEVKAIIETEEIQADIVPIVPGIVILKNLDDNHSNTYLNLFNKRLGYIHELDELIIESNLDLFWEDFSNINWDKYIDNDFVVRVKRVNYSNINYNQIANKYENSKSSNGKFEYISDDGEKIAIFKDDNNSTLNSTEIEKELGHIILQNTEKPFNVNLKDPNSFIRLVIIGEKVLIGIRRGKANKKHFYEMKPHKRPFFYPGSMSPKLARCMVNLSKVKEGDTVLDPFCGTGGILIEAGMIGANLIGSDVNWKMKNGTLINLDYCNSIDYNNLANYEAHHLDVRELKLPKKVDAVVTDPPYGISTSTGGEDSAYIFKEFLASISYNMKENALLCMASPHYLDINSILKDLDFELLDRHEIKMHKSLTRIISVIRKID